MSVPSTNSRQRLREVCSVFLRLGILGFGGPLATVALMEEETCRKRAWLDARNFAEAFALIKLFPGPIASQMAAHLGYQRAGIAGGFAAGICFLLPSFLMVVAIAATLTDTQASLALSAALSGVQAGAIAIILFSAVRLGTPFRSDQRAWVVALLSGIGILVAPRWEPALILGFGAFGVLLKLRKPKSATAPLLALGFFAGAKTACAAVIGVERERLLLQLFWICFKAGAFVFGTGIAIIPLLEADFVTHGGWITHADFLNGLAVGQMTPGPFAITVTFIGYRIAGWAGAVACTAGIFLPSFINMMAILPRIQRRMTGNPLAAAFTRWAMPAVVGCILGSAGSLFRKSVTSPGLAAVFLAAFVLSLRFGLPAWLLILLSGAAGFLLGQ